MENNSRQRGNSGVPPGMNNNPKNNRKGPKFNMFWIYGLIVLTLIGLQFFGSDMDTNEKKISFLEFKNDYLEKGNVKEVVIVNKEIAEVYLKEKPAPAQPENKGPLGFGQSSQKGPDFIFNIGTYE